MFLDKIIDKFYDSTVKRHIAKTITWRIIGTIDTMILGWFITGDPLKGLKIGGLEVITKMILYFLHERAWFRINFGLDKRKSEREKSAK